MAVHHIWSKYELTDSDAIRRHALAQESWRLLHWKDHPILDSELPRLFNEGTKKLPFIRDLFDKGTNDLPDDDIIVFTNSDIGMSPKSDFSIVFAMQSNDAGYAFRKDFGHRLQRLPTTEEIQKGREYCGTDLFFFRVLWWKAHRLHMPDMLLGREAWDACLRVLIENTNSNKPLSLPFICWHERHGGNGYWEHPKNRYTLPGQIHNLTLAKRFMKNHGRNPASFGIF